MPLFKYNLDVSKYWSLGSSTKHLTGFSVNFDTSCLDFSAVCSGALFMWSMEVTFSLEYQCYPTGTASFAFCSGPCASGKRILKFLWKRVSLG